MWMRVCSLASGSSGNAVYAECDDGAILIDAGLSGTGLLANLNAAGGNAAKVAGVVVTHDHIDHVRGAGILHRRQGWGLWMTAGTRDGSSAWLGKARVGIAGPGECLEVGGFTIEFLGTAHDGTEPVAVVLRRGDLRCGVLTDLGHVFSGLPETMAGLDFAFLESNYDPVMLKANRRYPENLKRRIQSPSGHISNREAAELIRDASGERLRGVVLSHLSENNNRPELASRSLHEAVGGRIESGKLRATVAPRHRPLAMVTLTSRRGMHIL